ncbi:MAG: branched-chain amino acid ABC transporter permease [Burkholderiaceae bacterium]
MTPISYLFRGRQGVLLVALLVVLCVTPLFTDGFVLSVLTLVFLFGAVGLAWNLMMGYAGQLSLGHSLYFGTGAYAMGLLITKFDLSAWWGLPASFLVGAVLGAVTGALGFRFAVRGVYFALLTIAFAEFARILFEHWSYAGGAGGLFLKALEPDNQPLLSLRGGARFFYYALLVTLLLIWLSCALLVRGRWGYYWRAVREDEDAARAIGVPALRMKVLACTISGGLTGICGAWFGLIQGSLFPDGVLGMRVSIDMIIAPIVGGLGTLFGPVLGAFVIIPLNELSKDLAQEVSISGLKLIIYGVLLMAIVLFAPEGIWPPLARRLRIRGNK